MEYPSRRLSPGRREYFWPHHFEEHASRCGNTSLAPVRDGGIFDLAQAGNSRRTAQGVDDVGVGVFDIHALIIRHALFFVKIPLTPNAGMPTEVPIRIAE